MYTEDSEHFIARPETAEERIVYSYIRRLASEIEPELATEWFYRLLYYGETLHEIDPNRLAVEALKDMLETSRVHAPARGALQPILNEAINDSLLFFVNRGFYTIGNRWRLDSSKHEALKSLITQLHQPPQNEPKNRNQRRLFHAVDQYRQREQFYLPLQRQMLLLSDQETDHTVESEIRFRDCFKQYFFLYETAAATPDIPQMELESLRWQQRQTAKKMGTDLQAFWQACKSPEKSQPVNPTRISGPQLRHLIWDYHPTRPNSYQQQAKTFDQQHRNYRTNQELCDQLFDYVMAPLIAHNPSYQANRFSHTVRDTLQQCIRGEERSPVNAILVTQMCIRLLKLLVCNTFKDPRFMYFQYLIDKVGHQVVTAVLLKIVLFRRTVRPWFENRFGILFHYWESYSIKEIPWLVQAFEHMNVALALNAQYIFRHL